MKLRIIPVLCFLIFTILKTVVANYKKCITEAAGDGTDNSKFVGKFLHPHLHIGKDFFTFTDQNGGHTNIHDGSANTQCNRANLSIESAVTVPIVGIGSFTNRAAVFATLRNFKSNADSCSGVLCANFLLDYCNNQEYVPTNNLPHFHCGKHS